MNLDLHDVFYLDALPSSHPISVNIENPVFQENFDRISYGKVNICVLFRGIKCKFLLFGKDIFRISFNLAHLTSAISYIIPNRAKLPEYWSISEK